VCAHFKIGPHHGLGFREILQGFRVLSSMEEVDTSLQVSAGYMVRGKNIFKQRAHTPNCQILIQFYGSADILDCEGPLPEPVVYERDIDEDLCRVRNWLAESELWP
jgi:hypothetical protein